MRFYDPSHPDSDEKGFRYFQKPYGRSLTSRDQLLDAFRTYFSAGIEQSPTVDETANGLSVSNSTDTNGDIKPKRQRSPPSIRTRTISNLLVQLRPLRRWFEENKSLRFYASSLLIVYEGDANGTNVDMANVKMIDFGRVRREAGGDQGYITGLSTLKHIFTDLLEEEDQRIRDSQS
jgi:Inositol polyphosphate kinase